MRKNINLPFGRSCCRLCNLDLKCELRWTKFDEFITNILDGYGLKHNHIFIHTFW